MNKLLFGFVAGAMLFVSSITANASMMGTADVNAEYTREYVNSYDNSLPTAEFDVQLTIGDLNITDQDSFGYCVDIFEGIGNGVHSFEFFNLTEMADDTYYEIAWLVDQFAPGTGEGLTLDQQNQAAAIQALIWETLYSDPSTFGVTSPPEVLAYYLAYSTALAGLTLNDDIRAYLDANYLVAINDGVQDLIVKVEPVPEPTTLFLLGAGIMGLVGLRRFKK